MKPYKLFLDDLRVPRAVYRNLETCDGDWYVVKDMISAVRVVQENGCPSVISFDNDLGPGELEGYDFAKWLVEEDQNGNLSIPQDFSWNVHSANPVSWGNINSLLENYIKFKYGVSV